MRTRLRGFSLAEVMIVLALSSALLLSGFYLLQHTSSIYHAQQQRLHSYATERYVQHRLTQSIRMAGLLPCGHINNQTPTITAISTTPPPSWLTTAVPNNDILQLNFANPKLSYLSKAMKSTHSILEMLPAIKLRKQQTYVISDCHHTDFFSTATPLHHLFGQHSMLSVLQTLYFYVRKSTDGASDALFVRDQTGRSEELATNITQFKVLFIKNAANSITAVHVKIRYTNNLAQDFIVRLRNQ